MNSNNPLTRMQKLAGIITENQEYYKDAEKDDAAHIDALEKDMKDDAEHTSEGKMTKSELKAKIKEMILAELNEDATEDEEITDDNADYDPLAEAKKDKDEEVEDVTIDDTETLEDPTDAPEAAPASDVPNIQSHLQAAYAEAKQLGDEKLITQIANTITYFTKAHVLDTAPVNESMSSINNIETFILALGYESFNDFFNDNPGGEDALMDWMLSVPDYRKIFKQKELIGSKQEDINESMFPMLKKIIK